MSHDHYSHIPAQIQDSGLLCLALVARFLGQACEPAQLQHEFALSAPATTADLLRIARFLKLKAGIRRGAWERLPQIDFPAIALHKDGSFFILGGVRDDAVLVQYPQEPCPQTLSREAFEAIWTGELILLPGMSGDIRFEDVVFRYQPEGRPVLRGVSLHIRPGEIVGIIGPSGSGKSTLAKLVQRLYVPESGRVTVDGVDLAMVEPAWLRRQIGVVPQTSILFNRSVRDNIAISDPTLPMEAVIHAAKLAGAHDFILELPEGYDTVLAEQGASLSGGQRQRIAIARALINNPKILIFDEATSALDFESEQIITENMQHICKGRTTLIIAHRPSTLAMATRIVRMEKGLLVESSHEEVQGHFAFAPARSTKNTHVSPSNETQEQVV